jgi:hypothetical protein
MTHQQDSPASVAITALLLAASPGSSVLDLDPIA